MDASFFVSCETCEKKPTCTRICPELEKTLPKPGTGRLKHEFSFDPHVLDVMAEQRAEELRYGKRRQFKDVDNRDDDNT
jgi:uncharacterized protein YlaI